jgi:hypothetical protein
VGSPRPKTVAPAVEQLNIGVTIDRMPLQPVDAARRNSSHVIEQIKRRIVATVGSTYEDQMGKPSSSIPQTNNSSSADVQQSKDISGSTYADQMASTKSKISSDHAPPKPKGMNSPKRSPAKSAIPQSPSLDATWYISLRICANEVGLRNLLPIAPHLKLWKEVGISPVGNIFDK